MSTYNPTGLKALYHNSRRFLAKKWLRLINPKVIALTGSHGKTNTAHILKALLPEALITDTNLDTIYNVPVTALKARPGDKIAIFELGIDRRGEMSRHLEIVKPFISIVTGISAVHSDAEHLGSLENIVSEKRKILSALPATGYAILNADDEKVRNMASATTATIMYYGTHEQPGLKLAARQEGEVTIDQNGTTFTMVLELENLTLRQEIHSGLIGSHHVGNILGSFLAYYLIEKQFGLSLAQILEQFRKTLLDIKPLTGRMSLEQGPMGTILLNDALRANPASMLSGLETLKQFSSDARKIAILGEMGELGDLAEAEHRKVGELLARLNLDLTLCIGPLQVFTAEEALKHGLGNDRVKAVPGVFEAVQILKETLRPGDVVYLKGSLLRHLERIILSLDGTKVGCTVVACPLYNQCGKCKYLQTGYPSL